MKLIDVPTKKTLRGMIIFVIVLVICFILPDIIHFFDKEETFQLTQLDIQQKEKINRLTNYKSRSFSFNKKQRQYNKPPSKFNPNDYSIQDWMNLGLSEKQAAVVLKFTRYRLKSNEDLKKIFVIPDQLYVLIKDSTVYDVNKSQSESYSSFSNNESDNQKSPKSKVDINSASLEDLMNVRGIGPFFAKQIIKKRDELGGFYTYEQLLEVWKVDEEKLANWSPFLEVNTSKINKLNVNVATIEELEKHPYISWNLANSIVKYKEQNGNYTKIEQLKKSALMTTDLFEKLKPYLSL
ncbi:MAG: ComEA family DNA-binding protein [Fluviicola sp.]|jgi:competence ComEA-like helix-hairpin-helix protein